MATKRKVKDPVAALKKEVKVLKKEVRELRDALDRATEALAGSFEDIDVTEDTVYRLRRVLLRKGVISVEDLSYEYLKEKFKRKKDRGKFKELDLPERK